MSGTHFYRHRGADARRKRCGAPYVAVKSAENPSLCAKTENHLNGCFFVLLYGVPENEERIFVALRWDSKGVQKPLGERRIRSLLIDIDARQ